MSEAFRHSSPGKSAANLVYPLPTLEATAELAKLIAQHVQPPLTIALVGTLGAGKTQWVRYLAGELGVAAESVTSPTYVLQQTYAGQFRIHHFDFYRLASAAQVWDLGIDELYEQRCLVIIEWADKFPECLPQDYLRVTLSQAEDEARTATLSAYGPCSHGLLQRL